MLCLMPDYFTVIRLIDQHVGVLKIKSLFCFLLISGKQVNLSTPLKSEPTWAVTGMNWQVFTLTDDSRKRSWSWSCVKWINLKVRNDDISRRSMHRLQNCQQFFPRGLCMEGNGKIIVVRGQALPNCKPISFGRPGDERYTISLPHPTTPIFKRTAKTLIWLCACAGWSECALGTHYDLFFKRNAVPRLNWYYLISSSLLFYTRASQ